MVSARSSSRILSVDSEPIKFVRSDFRMLAKSSHMIQLGCFKPSSCPIETCVASPEPRLYTRAQTTVENVESINVCRLTTTKTRNCLGSPAGLCTRYRSPRLIRIQNGRDRLGTAEHLQSPYSGHPLPGSGFRGRAR